MREPIDVDPDVFDAASMVFGVDIHSPLVDARTSLESGLSGSGGMAGSDPAGSQWASSYDSTAATVHSLVGDLGNATITLAALLQRTGFNHGIAESASDPTRSVPTPPDDNRYTPDSGAVPALPSAYGGSTGPPALWWVVQHTVGYVWPNGDPDKLRTAAQAWSTASTAIGATTSFLPEALDAVATQQSPEVSDAFTVCESMNGHIIDVGVACAHVATACTDFANGIDKAHTDIENELESLAAWTAGIETGGFLLGLITAGGAEVGAQAAEAARVTATASRIGRIIQTLIDLAGVIARSVANVMADIAQVAERLKLILGARLSKVVATLVARLPGGSGDAADAAFNQISAWSLKWSERGLEIESQLGGNLPRSFPTIDKWENGVATSIKSVDLSAPTYQSPSALASKLRGYIDKMAGFKGASFDGTAIRLRDIQARALEVAIQPGTATPAQEAVINQLSQYATSKGVQLTVVEVRVTAQMVEVDLRKDEYIVSVYSRTGKGVWVLDGTPERVPNGATADRLGTAITGALDRSRSGLPELTRDSKPAQPLLDLLQIRDYATYAKGTRSVEVYRDGDSVEVTPRRNEGGRNGFTPIEEEIATFSPLSPQHIGEEVLAAFTKAT